MNAGPIPFDTLFDPDFLASLSHLSIAVQRVAAGGRFGERLSKDRGAGIEFRDFRGYSPGDDPRAIDWNIYRRLGKVFVRLYEEQQDLPLYLMPDVSTSMFHEEDPRALTALRCALALATISLSHHDSTALFPFAEKMDMRVKSMSGKANTMAFAEHLSRLAPPAGGARTNVSGALRRIADMNLRRGLLVVISDFFDPAGVDSVRDALRSIRHRMLFVQLVRPSDAVPALDGDLRLRDCETGDSAEITVTPHVLTRYREAYASFNNELAALVKYFHGGLLRLDVEEDLVTQLNTVFAAGNLSV
jgi:uncharacterized protein (DUF58 family)